jgi:hypothetical protein
MDVRDSDEPRERAENQPPGYEPPRVERVLTPAELEREFQYAGQADGTGPG